jgi:predicted ribosome quality control (RQC) complex YloA/Tae2 family protein
VGTSGTQTSFFVAGVSGVQTGVNNAVPVLIDSNGQLGTMNSSRRYKEDIQDMGDASNGLMRLRPVTFRYQKPFADGSKPIQYGLIAEEVADVYPDLVAHSADGQIETVKYQVLDSMLLNEVQRQQNEIGSQQDHIQRLEDELSNERQENQALQQRLSRLEATMATVASSAKVQQEISH